MVRCAVLRLGLAPRVRSAVTIAAPHRGAPVACLGWGRLAAELRPGSALLSELGEAALEQAALEQAALEQAALEQAADGVASTAYWSEM